MKRIWIERLGEEKEGKRKKKDYEVGFFEAKYRGKDGLTLEEQEFLQPVMKEAYNNPARYIYQLNRDTGFLLSLGMHGEEPAFLLYLKLCERLDSFSPPLPSPPLLKQIIHV